VLELAAAPLTITLNPTVATDKKSNRSNARPARTAAF
jgi:hypothetical protein